MRTLFILRGAPASGKSTWIKEHELEPYTISTDTLRLMYQSPITTEEGQLAISQNHDKEVWDMLMELLERRMDNGEFVIIDATHYKSTLINKYKDLVSKYRYRVYVVDFTKISIEELKKRNSQRGFRTVPEEVIDKMYIALTDDKEVKKSYKIITPEEAVKMIEEPLTPYKIPEEINKVVIFGDIHGCYEPLKEYFDKNPFNENTNYIFTGDYIDRGIQNKEVLDFLISIKDKKNVVLLEGNHERWLRIYSQKDYEMMYYKNSTKPYINFYVKKIKGQLKDKLSKAEKEIRVRTNKINTLSELLKQEREINPEAEEIYYEFTKINVRETQENNTKIIRELTTEVEKLKRLIILIEHEEENTKGVIETILKEYTLGTDITNILEKNYTIVRKQNPIRSKEFIDNTYEQIKEIDKAELRRLCDKLAQLSYIEFNGLTYLVTHGGLPCMPTIKTATNEIIKGVGKYEDHKRIEDKFIVNTKGTICQIHGHRNIMKDPICVTEGLTYNLEGQVEFGGELRIVEIEKYKDKGYEVPITKINTIGIKNNTYTPIQEEIKEEKTDIDILKEMYESKWVQVKNLKDNVISFNFTRDAFEKDKWDTITCHARGLFVDKCTGQVVARSFSKFFNYKQNEITEPGYMKENIVWPLIGYKKENGFLGIISKYNDKVYFFTKSSDEGDYVNWFIGVLCDNYGIFHIDGTRYTDVYNCYSHSQNEKVLRDGKDLLKHLKQKLICKLSPLLEEGYSYVFECIDKDNDPHIIKYNTNRVYLLEVFKNQLKEEHVSYDKLCKIATELKVWMKEKELVFDNWEDFETWKDKFRQGITQWDCKHEGYVFEDQNGYRVKFKSSFYNFWKQMRALKEIYAKGRQNKKIYKTKEEIQVVKLLESIPREELQKLSIIDIEEMFYKEYEE